MVVPVPVIVTALPVMALPVFLLLRHLNNLGARHRLRGGRVRHRRSRGRRDDEKRRERRRYNGFEHANTFPSRALSRTVSSQLLGEFDTNAERSCRRRSRPSMCRPVCDANGCEPRLVPAAARACAIGAVRHKLTNRPFYMASSTLNPPKNIRLPSNGILLSLSRSSFMTAALMRSRSARDS